MAEERTVRAQLGCGTFILIALIVLFFSGARQVDDLEDKIDSLEDEIVTLTQEVRQLRQAVAPETTR